MGNGFTKERREIDLKTKEPNLTKFSESNISLMFENHFWPNFIKISLVQIKYNFDVQNQGEAEIIPRHRLQGDIDQQAQVLGSVWVYKVSFTRSAEVKFL